MKFIEKIKNSKFLKFFSNIYILITTVFLIWIIFIDSNSLAVNMKLKSQINELENKIKHLQNEIDQEKIFILYSTHSASLVNPSFFKCSF